MSDALSRPPPSGGMGGHDVPPASQTFGPMPTPYKPSGWRRLIVLAGVVGVVGICGGVSMRLYIDRAKTMEARLSLRKIANLSRAAYARDGKLCPSASAPTPEEMPESRKYMPRPHEWERDAATHAGFACLGFEGPPVQYFQYTYVSTSTGFIATARGRVHDDDRVSELTAVGTIDASGELHLKKP